MEKFWNAFGRGVMKAYTHSMMKMSLRWDAPLPPGPKILVANHPTTLDPFVMLSLVSEPISILVAAGIFKIPIFGRLLHASGHVPVPRQNGTVAFATALDLLKNGRTLGIFPEGSLTIKDGMPPRVRTGAARLALLANVPVVPIGIHLQEENIWYKPVGLGEERVTARFYLHGSYAMTVGKPMDFTGEVGDHAYVRSISNKILERIYQLARQSADRLDRRRELVPVGEMTVPVQHQ